MEHGKYLNVTVVIDGGDTVGLQMEGVDHIYIVKIRRGRFVGQIYGMLKRQVPYGKCLIFSIAGIYTTLLLVVEL